MTATLIVVRHGNTFAAGETPRRIGRRSDPPLVGSGRAQAIRLGEAFAAHDPRFDRVLASPLRRTRETAALILGAQAAPPPIVTADWLAEIDHGPDEDQTEAAVVARIGAAALAAWEAHALPPPGWDVQADMRMAAWRALFAGPDAGTTLLVTSNGAARFALLADAGLAAAATALPSLKLRTGAWGRIALDAGGPRLVEWDRRP